MKYHPNANNDIVGIIESEGGEAVVPDLLDFFMYCLNNNELQLRKDGGKLFHAHDFQKSAIETDLSDTAT